MFVEMTCGACDAHFQVDAEDNDTAMWLLINRYVNAHVACGYMTAVETDNTIANRRVVRAKD